MKYKLLLAALCMASTGGVAAEELSVEMIDLNSGNSAGSIIITESEYGTVFTPQLKGLTPGLHGFHIHTNPSCDSADKGDKTVIGGAAGGHYDPAKTDKHGLPWTTDNHLGDLPAMYVDIDGNASQPILAPRVQQADLDGHALMIHAGGDNHSDHPAPLGGGGARMVCGDNK